MKIHIFPKKEEQQTGFEEEKETWKHCQTGHSHRQRGGEMTPRRATTANLPHRAQQEAEKKLQKSDDR